MNENKSTQPDLYDSSLDKTLDEQLNFRIKLYLCELITNVVDDDVPNRPRRTAITERDSFSSASIDSEGSIEETPKP